MPAEARDLIGALLKKEPAQRLGSYTTGGYSALKSHAYFSGTLFPTLFDRPAVRVPTLSELAIRAVGDHLVAYADATVLVTNPLPRHCDPLRLSAKAREAVRHYLLRTRQLAEPKVSVYSVLYNSRHKAVSHIVLLAKSYAACDVLQSAALLLVMLLCLCCAVDGTRSLRFLHAISIISDAIES
jgi:hypothetical protein